MQINHQYNYNTSVKKNLKILIIDDDENVSIILQDFLSIRGHSVDIVNEGTRGITKTLLQKYDIVFIDYHLNNDIPPNILKDNLTKENILDGAYVSEIINNSNALIFGYTGDSSREAINKFKISGADGIIFKPVEPKIINKLMQNLEMKFDKFSISQSFRSLKTNIIIF